MTRRLILTIVALPALLLLASCDQQHFPTFDAACSSTDPGELLVGLWNDQADWPNPTGETLTITATSADPYDGTFVLPSTMPVDSNGVADDEGAGREYWVGRVADTGGGVTVTVSYYWGDHQDPADLSFTFDPDCD
jgi:hypothetical protein